MIRRQQVTDFRASGQTAATWCSENNLKVSTLRYWLNKCNREAKENQKQEAFIELKPTSSKEVPIIIKIGGVSIELYTGFQVETLRDAIMLLSSLLFALRQGYRFGLVPAVDYLQYYGISTYNFRISRLQHLVFLSYNKHR